MALNAPSTMADPRWINAGLPGQRREKSESARERQAAAIQAAITGTGPIYTAPDTDLAPIVAAPPPAAAPAPVAHPAAWTPLDAAAGGGGIGGAPMGGSGVMPAGDDGFGISDVTSMLGTLGSLGKLASGSGGLGDWFGGDPALEMYFDDALWANMGELPTVEQSMARNPQRFMEAIEGLPGVENGHLNAALALGGDAAKRAAFMASEFGAPGNAPSMLELTEMSGGLGEAFGEGAFRRVPQFEVQPDGSFLEVEPSAWDNLFGSSGDDALAGSGGNDLFSGIGDFFSPSSGSQTLNNYAASQGLTSTAAAPWIGALPASSNTIGTMLAGWGGLSAPGAASLVAAGMPSLPAGMLAGLASPAAWAALPITLGIQSLMTRGDTKEEEAAKANWIARVEKNLADIRHGRIDSASGLANITMGRRNEPNRHLLARTVAGTHDVSPLGADMLRLNQAQGGLLDVAQLDRYQKEGHFDDPTQIAELDRWRKMLLADAGIADRAEYDRLFADWKNLSQGQHTGGIAGDEWRRTLGEGYLNNEHTRRLVDLFGGNELRDSLGLEGMNASNYPSGEWGPPPSIPSTTVPLDYRDNEFINPDYQPPRPDLMEGIQQLPDGRYWRSEGPGDVASSGNMVSPTEYASLQAQMAAPQPTPQQQASMINFGSFADVPGMRGRSSGDLVNIDPGFVDPAAKQAYAGYIGNKPGAGRSLLDALGANPQALARFQSALA